MELTVKKKHIVKTFLQHKILIDKALLERLNKPQLIEHWYNELEKGTNAQQLLDNLQPITQDAQDGQKTQDTQNIQEKQQVKETQDVQTQETTQPPTTTQQNQEYKILWQYTEHNKKRTVQDFVDYFNQRYKQLEKLVRSRPELTNLIGIGRLKQKKDDGTISIIGMILDKQETKNNHIILTVEDTTGTTKILISNNRKDLIKQTKDLVLDEVIGITGKQGDDIIFADTIVIPDVPFVELKKAPHESSMAILSCVHVGSAQFEHEKFNNFLKWTQGQHGTPQEKELAKNLKYIFICGDVVDGVGIYPGQEQELTIPDITEQYNECAKLLKQIPQHITILVAPGNHDACRIEEPQPPLPTDYAAAMYTLPNVINVCNPCYININTTETFPGFNVLMYHGYSFDDYGEIVDSIKTSGLHLSDRAPMIMRYLLQKRHLAPQHATNLYIPDPRKDPMVIETVPDLFIAGHIHKSGTTNHRGISIIAGSCFQGKTTFQEKVGHEPDPGTVPVVDLKTRKITLLRF